MTLTMKRRLKSALWILLWLPMFALCVPVMVASVVGAWVRLLCEGVLDVLQRYNAWIDA